MICFKLFLTFCLLFGVYTQSISEEETEIVPEDDNTVAGSWVLGPDVEAQEDVDEVSLTENQLQADRAEIEKLWKKSRYSVVLIDRVRKTYDHMAKLAHKDKACPKELRSCRIQKKKCQRREQNGPTRQSKRALLQDLRKEVTELRQQFKKVASLII